MCSLRFVVAPALAAAFLASCSFEGAKGDPPPDAEAQPDAAVDAPAVDSPPRVVCPTDFKQIGLSSYKLVDELLLWNNAISRCRDFEHAHLVTFETLAEVAAVTDGLPLTLPAWSAIAQASNSLTSGAGWTNRIGPVQTPVPLSFPWRTGEPNDGGGPGNLVEENRENFAELQPEAKFDDAPDDRTSRALCECTPTP